MLFARPARQRERKIGRPRLMTRFTKLLFGTAAAVAVGMLLAPGDAAAQQKTLRFIPQADLKLLDPIWTTQYIVRNHGYLVYDTLFATNSKFEVKPQMVETYEVS